MLAVQVVLLVVILQMTTAYILPTTDSPQDTDSRVKNVRSMTNFPHHFDRSSMDISSTIRPPSRQLTDSPGKRAIATDVPVENAVPVEEIKNLATEKTVEERQVTTGSSNIQVKSVEKEEITEASTEDVKEYSIPPTFFVRR